MEERSRRCHEGREEEVMWPQWGGVPCPLCAQHRHGAHPTCASRGNRPPSHPEPSGSTFVTCSKSLGLNVFLTAGTSEVTQACN